MTEVWATPRERDVIKLLADGHTKRETARLLDVTENTVREHVKRLQARWSARNVAHVVAIAKDGGIV